MAEHRYLIADEDGQERPFWAVDSEDAATCARLRARETGRPWVVAAIVETFPPPTEDAPHADPTRG